MNQLKRFMTAAKSQNTEKKDSGNYSLYVLSAYKLFCAFIQSIFQSGKVNLLGEPVSQEMIKLNESDSGQLLDYFKINKPNNR